MKALITISAVIMLISGYFSFGITSCNFYLIKKTDEGVIIEKVKLFESETAVFEDPSIISYVMVFEPGSKSGELVRAGEKFKSISAELKNGVINITIAYPDGQIKAMPPIDVEKAKTLNSRINISGHNGYKVAYRIENYEDIFPDHGPVIDMFAGKIPLGEGDYSLLTETHESRARTILKGVAELEIISNWMVVTGHLMGNNEAKFILDIGAATTVIDSKLLDDSYHIRPFKMIEYSSDGKKISDASIGGATGTVDNILGIASLPYFRFGTITCNDQDVTVLNAFPEGISKYGISGIIGRDILEQAEIIKIEDLNGAETAKIEFIPAGTGLEGADHQLKYSRAGGHFFTKGKISNIPISFLIDTGSGKLILDKAFVEKNNIPYKAVDNKTRIATGLDGKGIEITTVNIMDIEIGDIQLGELEFDLSDLFVFEQMGIENETVLLGMEFFNDYSVVVFDFSEEKVLLWN